MRKHGAVSAAGRQSTSTAASPVNADTDGQKRRRYRILLGATLAVVLLVAVGIVGYLNQSKHKTTPAAAGTPSPPAAVLDGTYRLVYDFTKQTNNGAPDPVPNTDNTRWWAFRSLCGLSTGCVATGTKLDPHNSQVMLTPSVTSVLHFADGHWQETPDRTQVDHPRCLGIDGKVVAGADTEMTVQSWEPLPDGTLRGVWTATFLTNECGLQGAVYQVPFVATRTGDVPTGATVADPAEATASTPTSTAAPPAAGPALDGAYRLDFDGADQTANDVPVTGSTKETHWWAFRSLCTSIRCVATGAELADNYQQEPSGNGAVVLHFSDGTWQNTPHPGSEQCHTGNGAERSTMGWSLEPQPDGTLRGASTVTVLTNECGRQGVVFKTPLVATRVGDVPQAVILADPALFES